MFNDSALNAAFSGRYTLDIASLVLSEFNLNDIENIEKIGNYRYRPYSPASAFYLIETSYDENDANNAYTDADISYEEYPSSDINPYKIEDKTRQAYYSLGDCFFQFRPRSGINKASYFNKTYIDNIRSANRPRYYMPSQTDYFKYWSSYRKENFEEFGISDRNPTSGYYGINDACPFIVYKNAINVNRIVVKMQTHVGSIDLGNIQTRSSKLISDPLYDSETTVVNAKVPREWKIQYLDENDNWVDALGWTPTSLRGNGLPIIPRDGHVEIFYGIKIPNAFRTTFTFLGYTSEEMLPTGGIAVGYAYVIGATNLTKGTLKVWDGTSWTTQTLEYGFSLYEDDIIEKNGVAVTLTNPKYYEETPGQKIYREFIRIRGLRVVVKRMNTPDSTLDLIELSPRLLADLSDYTESFEITKSIVGDDDSALPVGSLAASNGTLTVFNYNNIFSENNIFEPLSASGSIVTEYANINTKFMFYEKIIDIDGYDKYIPLKTFYAQEFPRPFGSEMSLQIELRDLFFRFEIVNAPSILAQESSLTFAVANMLDYIGFSNYIFKNITSKNDPIIPYFFVEPSISVAEILQRIAVATQTAMFFDEYNNFVVMSKEYMLPNDEDRNTDITLYGDSEQSIPNIVNVSEFNTKIINDGEIKYTIRYVQKEISSLSSAVNLDNERVFRYKPVLLWEVSGTEQTKTKNEKTKTSSGYSLSAAALNSDLTNSLPYADYPILVSDARITSVSGSSPNWTVNIEFRDASSLSLFTAGMKISATSAPSGLPIWPGLTLSSGSLGTGGIYTVASKTSTTLTVTVSGGTTPQTGRIINIKNLSISPTIYNNTIDVGENIYWISKFYGYFYANGEIIKYDAVEFSIPGTGDVWISNNQDYQYYFSKVPFNGKIYPTGRIRIFAEPYYEIVNGNIQIKSGSVKFHGRGQFNTEITNHFAGISDFWTNGSATYGMDMRSELIFTNTPTSSITNPNITTTKRVVSAAINQISRKSIRNSIIKNFMSSKIFEDGFVNKLRTTQSGTIQSSALIYRGPLPETSVPNHRDFVSYTYKDLRNSFSFRHFGTRMRIIGRIDNNNSQIPNGATSFYTATPDGGNKATVISGGSGGIGILVDPSNGSGYYFEITALTESNLQDYFKYNSAQIETQVLHNVNFYKVHNFTQLSPVAPTKAIPRKLWGGLTNIIVDRGIFAGQNRLSKNNENTSVYDLSIEYEEIGPSTLRFYLYINNNLIQIVDDTNKATVLGSVNNVPLPAATRTSVALFVRGSSELMFENVYALESLTAKDSNEVIAFDKSNVFDDNGLTRSEALRKYSLSGMIQSSYLENINTSREYKIYFEEFGTIMRECAYFNIRYDKAYPALYSTIAKSFTLDKSYSISGFYGGAYTAEFLIFNTADKTIILDESTGAYLRILGVTFSQDTEQTLTVDDYFDRVFQNPIDQQYNELGVITPTSSYKKYDEIRRSRSKYGNQQFSLESYYIQSEDDANRIMGWIIDKSMRPRKELVVETYPMPHLQLGDLVQIKYDLPGNIEFIDSNKKFIIKEITYTRSADDISNILKLVEV